MAELVSVSERRKLRRCPSQLVEVELDAQTYPNGRFARLHDPQGNQIAIEK